VLDREEVERLMLAKVPQPIPIERLIIGRCADVAADLLREFGHVAGCHCHDAMACDKAWLVCEGEPHPKGRFTDRRCFHQSPAKAGGEGK